MWWRYLGRPHRRPIRQPYAAGGHDADVFRAEKFMLYGGADYSRTTSTGGGTGFRPQGFAYRRGQNVRRRLGSARQTCAITRKTLTRRDRIVPLRAKTTNIRQTCRFWHDKNLLELYTPRSISAIWKSWQYGLHAKTRRFSAWAWKGFQISAKMPWQHPWTESKTASNT